MSDVIGGKHHRASFRDEIEHLADAHGVGVPTLANHQNAKWLTRPRRIVSQLVERLMRHRVTIFAGCRHQRIEHQATEGLTAVMTERHLPRELFGHSQLHDEDQHNESHYTENEPLVHACPPFSSDDGWMVVNDDCKIADDNLWHSSNKSRVALKLPYLTRIK